MAFSLFNRARVGDACVPQLDLAALTSLDEVGQPKRVEPELERAARDCPRDPTPLWLEAEWQSMRMSVYVGAGGTRQRRWT